MVENVLHVINAISILKIFVCCCNMADKVKLFAKDLCIYLLATAFSIKDKKPKVYSFFFQHCTTNAQIQLVFCFLPIFSLLT